MSSNWFLIQLKRNSHRIAERNLNQQGFTTFLPLVDFTSRIGSKFSANIKPLFPGYMFVTADLDRAPWLKINNTLGVSRLICQDGIPMRVPEDIISALMSRCDRSGKLLPPGSLMRGDSVRIISGALANFVATVEQFDSEQRIWVLLDIMGHATRVRVAADQIKLQN